jgi:hypothetical protein
VASQFSRPGPPPGRLFCSAGIAAQRAEGDVVGIDIQEASRKPDPSTLEAEAVPAASLKLA